MLKIDRITIAVIQMEEMVRFYNAVFDADLRPVNPHGEFPFHMGHLAGLELFFCPNTIPQIEADKNRQQLRFVVDDIEAVIHTAVMASGNKIGDIQHEENALVGGITDPDGNSIELIQYF